MVRSGIAEVAVKAVFGILRMHNFDHVAIASDLGQDGCGGDFRDFAIAFDHRFSFNIAGQTIAVNVNFCGYLCQSLYRAAHRRHAGPQNIELVDFAVIDERDRVNGFGQNLRFEPLSLFARELFGVVEPLDLDIDRDDDGGGDNGSSQRTATGFIDSSASRKSFKHCETPFGSLGTGQGQSPRQ